MALTAKQEGFAQSVADGMSQADAYRANYSAENMTDRVVWVKASELMADGKVSVRVQELRDALADKQLWTRADSVSALKEVVASGKGSEVTGAVKELNAMHGYNEPVKSEVMHKGLSSIKFEAVDSGSEG